MRLSYAIKFEDFKALQPPFVTRAGSNAGFKGVLVACMLIALLGIFCLIQGLGPSVGGFLIGLGLVAALAAYVYERHSVSAKKRKYEHNVADNYQRVHCRDQRIFAVDSNGFTASCNCGSVTRPWAELAAFSENDAHFVLCTKTNSFSTIPKSAFPSPADIAEFRALVDAKLNQDRPFTARHFDFKFEMRDYRRAYWVHTLKAGGWRRAIKALAIYAYIAYGSFILWHSISAKDPAARAALVGALVSAPLLRLFGKRKQYYLGPVRTYFSEVGLHVQYPARLGRWHWSEFIGYLEDDSVLLLYLSSKLYALIPKRALVGPAYDFNKLVMEKLSRYDHRNPSVCRSPEAPPNKVSSAAGNPSV